MNEFVHIVLLLLGLEGMQQGWYSLCCSVSSLPLPLPEAGARTPTGLLTELPAYVTSSLQFLTRTLELGAHHSGARLSTISCESWEPVATTLN